VKKWNQILDLIDIGETIESYSGVICEISGGEVHVNARSEDESDNIEYRLDVAIASVKATKPIRKGDLIRVRWRSNELLEACIIYLDPPLSPQERDRLRAKARAEIGPELPELPPIRYEEE